MGSSGPRPPGRAPRGLERLAALCLQAEPKDTRLGDLSELYVRSHEQTTRRLGGAPGATAAARLAADLHYLGVSANVVVFARVIEPALRLAAPGAMAFIVNDLWERAMTTVQISVRKLVLPVFLLVGGAFLVHGAMNVWYTWRQTEALMIDVQRQQADALAAQIEQFIAATQTQIGWSSAGVPAEQQRVEWLRLLRSVPAITELTHVGADGKEALFVSRLRMDKVDAGADYTNDVRFTEAKKRQTYVGPVHFPKPGEPYVSIAVARGGAGTGVTLAEVSIKKVWDLVAGIKVGETGYAYVVDGEGRLIADRDPALASSQQDLSSLPQVQAALAGAVTERQREGRTFDTSPSGVSVLSASAPVPSLGWQVFVERTVAEVWGPLWSVALRGILLLVLGLAAVVLAGAAATRRVTVPRPAQV
jgi:hypothetical protein